MKRLALDKPDGEGRRSTARRCSWSGTVKGLKSLAAPWVFCSLHTARHLLGFLLPPDHVTYLLARCDSPQRAQGGGGGTAGASTART